MEEYLQDMRSPPASEAQIVQGRKPQRRAEAGSRSAFSPSLKRWKNFWTGRSDADAGTRTRRCLCFKILVMLPNFDAVGEGRKGILTKVESNGFRKISFSVKDSDLRAEYSRTSVKIM